MININLGEVTQEFLKQVNMRLGEFIQYYIIVQSDIDEDNPFQDAFPEFLYRTSKERCDGVIRELLEFTRDGFPHDLLAIHEYALFHILRYCEISYLDFEKEKDENDPSLFNIIGNDYDDELTSTFENGGYSLTDFHHFEFYYQNLFYDHDFLDVGFYYKIFAESPQFFYESALINLDDYTELMPPDIIKNYYEFNKTYIDKGVMESNIYPDENFKGFTEHIETIISNFKYNIEHRGVNQLMWNDNNTSRNEKAIQALFSLQASEVCKEKDIDISRESNMGRGPVDFKFSRGSQYRILIEVKLASNPRLVLGLRKQLIQYMISENIKHAVYLVICFNEREYKRASGLKKLLRE